MNLKVYNIMNISKSEMEKGLDFIIQVGDNFNHSRADWQSTRQEFFGVRRFFFDCDSTGKASRLIDEVTQKYLEIIIDRLIACDS